MKGTELYRTRMKDGLAEHYIEYRLSHLEEYEKKAKDAGLDLDIEFQAENWFCVDCNGYILILGSIPLIINLIRMAINIKESK